MHRFPISLEILWEWGDEMVKLLREKLIRNVVSSWIRTMCNNIALALIFHYDRFDSVPQAVRHFNLNRKSLQRVVLTDMNSTSNSGPS